MKINTESDSCLRYTTIFKAHNLEIESPSIALSESAWIERNMEFSGHPRMFNPVLLIRDRHPFGITRFFADLLNSSHRFRAIHAASEGDSNPFQVSDCSHIAIAVSILCDEWFVIGIESFSNSVEPENTSCGPETTFFTGRKDQRARIARSQEPELIRIYEFVARAFAATWESDEARLLLHFLKCIVPGSPPGFTVLKLGLDHLFSEWHATVLAAAVFFEFLFTNESVNYVLGIQMWNELFGAVASVDVEAVKAVFAYRHVGMHSNASKSRVRIAEWKRQHGYSDLEGIEAVKRCIWSTAKNCVRAIINDESSYREFRKVRPD
jgi:hypothetical protein